jgi:hypothetical protein
MEPGYYIMKICVNPDKRSPVTALTGTRSTGLQDLQDNTVDMHKYVSHISKNPVNPVIL